MKAIGLPPSDPRVRQMNDAQWLWCYFNEIQDEKEEADSWKSRFDYLTYFINYDMAKSVHEAEARQNSNGSKYQQDGLHKNTQFELEMKAAALGYDPTGGLSIEEFLAEKEGRKPESNDRVPDIVNDSFEDLLAAGGFTELSDHEQGVGNANESLDDFLDKAFAMEQDLHNKQQTDVPIGIDEHDWQQLTSTDEELDDESKEESQKSEEEKFQEEIDLDLDFFEIDIDEDE